MKKKRIKIIIALVLFFIALIINFNNEIQTKKQKFVNFIGDSKKFTVNMDNVLFYTVEQKL